MSTVLVCLSNEDSDLRIRRYDAAFPQGPTHQGSWPLRTSITQGMVDRFRLDPPDICKVPYEDEAA